MKKLREVICVSGPYKSKMILVFQDGTRQTAGPHTGMTFGYVGQGTAMFHVFLRQVEFAFTDPTKFKAPGMYRADGTQMKGEIVGSEIRWEDGTTTSIPEFPY